jgi:hypothetical protein
MTHKQLVNIPSKNSKEDGGYPKNESGELILDTYCIEVFIKWFLALSILCLLYITPLDSYSLIFFKLLVACSLPWLLFYDDLFVLIVLFVTLLFKFLDFI